MHCRKHPILLLAPLLLLLTILPMTNGGGVPSLFRRTHNRLAFHRSTDTIGDGGMVLAVHPKAALVDKGTMHSGREMENMTVCTGHCVGDCKTYGIPIGHCFSPAKLFPGDTQWGTDDVLDTCNRTHLTRSFYNSSNGLCIGRNSGFDLPLLECIGPFGKPRPWGEFSCSGFV